ncbi:hypothetical protein GGI11_001688 [Coemansia sp. RSA 2049]|nr:hypothetical protein H4217_001491 [Coemansia sp. RSA 1939]KAJ2522639.1 hypothetical protein GGI11_001688 [Coemansia sp. RSA 2049]KAJ2694889.1 hypothetical protein GGH99_000439 [Coemansia sp. RSA 1285]
MPLRAPGALHAMARRKAAALYAKKETRRCAHDDRSVPRHWEGKPRKLPITRLDRAGVALLEQRLAEATARGVPPHMRFTYPQPSGLEPNDNESKQQIVVPAEAAVLLLLCSVKGRPSILFEERNRRLAAHSGEACFAGGKADDADTSLAATAVREAVEELGIAAADVRIIGELPPVPGKDYRLRVHPFVGVLAGETDPKTLCVSRNEVHRAFALPLEYFFNPANSTMVRFRQSRIRIPVYQTDKRSLTIWGLTAFILHEFLQRISAAAPPLSSQKGCRSC